MTREGYAKLTLTLAIIAAALAFSAALLEYVLHAEVKLSLIAAGIFMLAFGFGARSRIGSSK